MRRQKSTAREKKQRKEGPHDLVDEDLDLSKSLSSCSLQEAGDCREKKGNACTGWPIEEKESREAGVGGDSNKEGKTRLLLHSEKKDSASIRGKESRSTSPHGGNAEEREASSTIGEGNLAGGGRKHPFLLLKEGVGGRENSETSRRSSRRRAGIHPQFAEVMEGSSYRGAGGGGKPQGEGSGGRVGREKKPQWRPKKGTASGKKGCGLEP